MKPPLRITGSVEWRHIDLGRTGTQLRVGLGRRKRNEQQSRDEWK